MALFHGDLILVQKQLPAHPAQTNSKSSYMRQYCSFVTAIRRIKTYVRNWHQGLPDRAARWVIPVMHLRNVKQVLNIFKGWDWLREGSSGDQTWSQDLQPNPSAPTPPNLMPPHDLMPPYMTLIPPHDPDAPAWPWCPPTWPWSPSWPGYPTPNPDAPPSCVMMSVTFLWFLFAAATGTSMLQIFKVRWRRRQTMLCCPLKVLSLSLPVTYAEPMLVTFMST